MTTGRINQVAILTPRRPQAKQAQRGRWASDSVTGPRGRESLNGGAQTSLQGLQPGDARAHPQRKAAGSRSGNHHPNAPTEVPRGRSAAKAPPASTGSGEAWRIWPQGEECPTERSTPPEWRVSSGVCPRLKLPSLMPSRHQPTDSRSARRDVDGAWY